MIKKGRRVPPETEATERAKGRHAVAQFLTTSSFFDPSLGDPRKGAGRQRFEKRKVRARVGTPRSASRPSPHGKIACRPTFT
jgi:hypothetical protein